MGKRHEKTYNRREYTSENNHIERCATLLAVRETQSKTKMTWYYMLIRMTKMKSNSTK